jgi:hypothetical protein
MSLVYIALFLTVWSWIVGRQLEELRRLLAKSHDILYESRREQERMASYLHELAGKVRREEHEEFIRRHF